jgi:hypothetical protein
MTLVNRFSASFFLSSAVLAASALLGISAGTGLLSFRVFLVILFGLFILIILSAGERAFEIGMMIWVLLFALGYRTIQVSTYFRLHPLIVLLYFLGALYLLRRREPEESAVSPATQVVLIIGFLFWVNGWLQGLLRGRRWDLMVTEALNFLAIVPTFALVRHVARRPLALRRLLQAFYAVGVFIAGTGIFEYTFTDFARSALKGVANTDNIIFISGITAFERASFALWGSPAATFICLLVLPVALPCFAWAKSLHAKAIIIAGAVCLLISIYIGGYRSIWALTGVLVMIALLSRRNLLVTVIGATLSAFAISLVPEAGQERFVQALEVIQGISYDNSIITREKRFNDALVTGLIYPLGVGWGGTGWAHSDVAQVTGNLGLAAGIAFVVWYLLTLWRIWRIQQRRLTDPLALGLLCSFIGVGGLLLLQGVQVLPQLILPCWFIWALVHTYTQQVRKSTYAA